jgi:hypothetical protein
LLSDVDPEPIETEAQNDASLQSEIKKNGGRASSNTNYLFEGRFPDYQFTEQEGASSAPERKLLGCVLGRCGFYVSGNGDVDHNPGLKRYLPAITVLQGIVDANLTI